MSLIAILAATRGIPIVAIVVVVIIVVGLLLWGANHIPMEPSIKKIMNVVVIIALVLWLLLTVLGGWTHISSIRI